MVCSACSVGVAGCCLYASGVMVMESSSGMVSLGISSILTCSFFFRLCLACIGCSFCVLVVFL